MSRLLLVVALLVSQACVSDAEEESGTRAAVGLGALDRGIGVWLIRPKTWVGIEFDQLQWTWSKTEQYESFDKTFLSFHVRGSLTVKRIFTQGPAFQFGYISAQHISRQSEGLIGMGGQTRRSGSGSALEVGWGFLVKPWKKVIISFRQGVAYDFFVDTYSDYGYEYPYPIEQDRSDTHSLRLQKARLWVLIYF